MNNFKDFYAAHTTLLKTDELIKQTASSIIEEFNKSNIANISLEKYYNSEHERGQYFKVNNLTSTIFLGFNFNLMRDNDKEHFDFLFSIVVKKDLLSEEKLEFLKKNIDIYHSNEWVYLKIDKYILTQEPVIENFKNHIVESLIYLLSTTVTIS